jgi:hypothetical protein
MARPSHTNPCGCAGRQRQCRDDPKAYTRPFTATRTFKRQSWDLGEDICTLADEQHFRQGIVNPADAPSN